VTASSRQFISEQTTEGTEEDTEKKCEARGSKLKMLLFCVRVCPYCPWISNPFLLRVCLRAPRAFAVVFVSKIFARREDFDGMCHRGKKPEDVGGHNLKIMDQNAPLNSHFISAPDARMGRREHPRGVELSFLKLLGIPWRIGDQHFTGRRSLLSRTAKGLKFMQNNFHPASRFASLLAALIAVVVFCPAARAEPQAESQQKAFTAFDAPAKELLSKMTLDEKIGQMIQPDQGALKDPADIEKYFLGSLLSGGGSGPKNKEDYTLKGWTDMVDGYQRHALKTRLAIPLVYGVDAVHGHNNIPGAVIFPHNIALGCTRDAALVEKIERVTAEEVRATGINWVFAPCVACPQDERWGRTYEGFSEDPALVKELGAAAVRGFQGAKVKDLSDPRSVLACAKHFAGDGGTAYGSAHMNDNRGLDQGDTRVDEATLRRIHLAGYVSAVQAGVGTIMPSYSSWNGVKCSASHRLLTEILKQEMGFEGFLISDYNAIDQIKPDYKTDVEISINAGIDMVMLTDKYPVFFADLKELVHEGKVPMSRIDDAVTRILRVKFALGLMDKGRSPMADRALQESFGSAAHRQVARQAVRESLVLLKNDRSTLPLEKSARIHVAGRGADSLGMQCGGWTRDWQGKMDNVIPGGTTILAGLKAAASKDANVTYSLDGRGAEGAEVGVVVIGEKPYAEYQGDSIDLSLAKEDIEAVANMKKAGIPVVVVLLSGRPLLLGSVLDQADAFVAAWLPGSEGEGVADVLFGDAKPTGKLSRTWPRSMEQLPININTDPSRYDPLFKYGFGLSYGE
jgi:beta-glucosidase